MICGVCDFDFLWFCFMKCSELYLDSRKNVKIILNKSMILLILYSVD